MPKFVVKNLNVSYDYDFFGSVTVGGGESLPLCGRRFPNCAISLELFPYEEIDEATSILFKNISAGGVVNIQSVSYKDAVEPFKDEFKQFLLEKYPDRIVKDQSGFCELFAENKKGKV